MLRIDRGGFLVVTLALSMSARLAAQDTLLWIEPTPARLKPAMGASVERFTYES